MEAQKGYLLAELKIYDRTMFLEQYKSKIQSVLNEFNTRILTVVNNPKVIEGSRSVDQIVLLEFDSVANASRFYDSPQYQEILPHQFRSATADLFILEGSRPGSRMTG